MEERKEKEKKEENLHLSSTLKGHKGPVYAVRFTRNGNYLLSCGQDRTIQLWNPETGFNIKKYTGHNREVLAIDAIADNSQFVSCGGDKHITLWDVEGQPIRSYRGHSARINDVRYSPNQSVFVSGSYDRTVCIWDNRSRNTQPIQTLSEATDSVTSIAVTPNEIIAGGVDGYLRFYDIRKCTLSVDQCRVAVVGLSVTADNRCVLASFLDHAIRLIDRSSGKVLNTFSGHVNGQYQNRSSFYKNESCVLGGSEDGKLFLWNLISSKVLWSAPAHRGIVTATASHPTEAVAVSCSLDSTICVWEGR